MADFFISYNSADEAWAIWIAYVLEEEGLATVVRPGTSGRDRTCDPYAEGRRRLRKDDCGSFAGLSGIQLYATGMGCGVRRRSYGHQGLARACDGRKVRWLLFWYYGLRGLSLLLLPYTDFSLYGLSIFAVFYGLDWIATVPPTVKLTGQTFGREKAPLIFGWIFLAHQMGSATAAFGRLSRDALLSYLPAFFAAGVACIVASAAVLTIAKRTPEAMLAVPAE